jgi:hypothetical protein
VAAKMAVIIVFPLFVLVSFYASLNVRATSGSLIPNLGGVGGLYLTSTNNISQTTFFLVNQSSIQSRSFPGLLPAIPASFLVVLILILFVAFSLALILKTSRQGTTTQSTGFNEDELENRRKQVADALDQTASELTLGGEYRQTVLECYRKLSKILELRSEIDGRSLTARQFEILVETRLKLDSPYLNQITRIFEAARYSQHEISKADAEAAIDCLSHLSTVLRELRNSKDAG